MMCMQVDGDAVPFYRPGVSRPSRAPKARTGVLLCHGFTGSPASLRPWGEYLAAAGCAVAIPRLPGHGTSWPDLNRTGWPDWYAAVERDLLHLSEHCGTVIVAGLSMGGALALRLAQVRPAHVRALILVNPSLTSDDPRLVALPLIRRIVPSVSGIGNDIKKRDVVETGYDRMPLSALASLRRLWRTVAGDLASVTQPILLFRSAEDHVVEPSSARLLRAGNRAPIVEERTLLNSYHVATLDHDAPTIFEESLEFVRRMARTDGGR